MTNDLKSLNEADAARRQIRLPGLIALSEVASVTRARVVNGFDSATRGASK